MPEQTLLPWQEAVCDLRSYPWWPDVWTISNILAARHKKEPNDTISGTMLGLLPHLSAAELLQAPMLAMGSGLQLKREDPLCCCIARYLFMHMY